MKSFFKRYKFSIFAGFLSVFLTANIFIASNSTVRAITNGITLLTASSFVPGGLGSIFSLTADKVVSSSYEIINGGEASADAEEPSVSAVLGVPTETQEVADENKGIINEVHYTYTAGGSIMLYNGGYIKNSTNHTNDEVLSIISEKPSFTLKCDGSIEVLILHTHATECYNPFDSGVFDKSIPSRNQDNELNMVKVGATLTSELTKLGIGVVHCTTQHDYPSFNGAYNREAETVAAYRKKYPEIKVIIDLHRDAIEPNAETRVKPTAVINGKKAAQVMILSGCENGYMNFPDWAENLRFNAMLESKIETAYPGLTRPVYFNYSKYNQNLLTGATLIEIGSHANTVSEAVYSAKLLAGPIYETLLELKE